MMTHSRAIFSESDVSLFGEKNIPFIEL